MQKRVLGKDQTVSATADKSENPDAVFDSMKPAAVYDVRRSEIRRRV